LDAGLVEVQVSIVVFALKLNAGCGVWDVWRREPLFNWVTYKLMNVILGKLQGGFSANINKNCAYRSGFLALRK
jgi:hypothetical protein